MRWLIIRFTLLLVQILSTAYTFFTLPLYLVVQRPWNHWRRSRKCFAKPVEEGDPSSPYWRTGNNQRVDALRGVSTLDELARRAITKWPHRRSLGTRAFLRRTEEKQPGSGKVFKKMALGDYQWLTYGEVDRKIELTARGLRDDCNIPLVTLYATLGDEGIVSAVNETEVAHLVTSADLLQRVQNLVNRMPSLTHVVCIENPDSRLPLVEDQIPKVVPFSSLEGLSVSFVAEKGVPTPEDVAIVMYTSGSSGAPKGVVATHRNIIAAINGLGAVRQAYCTEEDTYIAYLPLAHVLELSVQSLVFGTGTPIGFSSALTLT
ncbi:hypothetical protein MRX96_007942 [Rhipicephalus microplus]